MKDAVEIREGTPDNEGAKLAQNSHTHTLTDSLTHRTLTRV